MSKLKRRVYSSSREHHKSGFNILLLCEGFEESDYVNRLTACRVWNTTVRVSTYNAKSLDNICACYTDRILDHMTDAIFIICDTETAPYEHFFKLRADIDKLLFSISSSKEVADVIYFVNPCTMQIILSHFADIKLVTNSKTKNARLIEKLTGVERYEADQSQRSAINRKITAENFESMMTRVNRLSRDYNVVPSSNLFDLFDHMHSGDLVWLEEHGGISKL